MSWTFSVKECKSFLQYVIGDKEHPSLTPVPVRKLVTLNKSIIIIYRYLLFLIFKLQELKVQEHKVSVNDDTNDESAEPNDQVEQTSNINQNRIW